MKEKESGLSLASEKPIREERRFMLLARGN